MTESTPNVLIDLPAALGTGPVLTHSDLLSTAPFVAPSTKRRDLLNRHLVNLTAMCGDRDVWFPTFNYSYCTSGVYDVGTDRSAVGALTEFVRTSSEWRTATPVFNFSGWGVPPCGLLEVDPVVDPFDGDSAFADLVRRDGTVVWYGAPLWSTTLLHHVERAAGGLAYRYDKPFHGVVTTDTGTTSTRLDYHVRPAGTTLQYDWAGLERAARHEGVMVDLEPSGVVVAASARALFELWLNLVQTDSLALLDDETRSWVAPRLESLGRPFALEDFE